jgi:hypothetical protein
MQRRSFVQTAGAVLLAQAAEAQTPRSRIYRFDYYAYRQGTQASRLNQFLTSQMPIITKHARVAGVFTPVMFPHTQTTLVVTGFAWVEDSMKIEADPAYQKAYEELERPADPPFDSLQRTLLAATDFSPEIAPPAERPKSPRYFEIRTYHSPTQRQLRMLHERFSSAEIAVFHRSGVHPILYANTIAGPDMNSLTYMMPFASLADREKAWAAFSADPEWVKVRDASVARGGQIVDFQNMSLWRATAFSPIQ